MVSLLECAEKLIKENIKLKKNEKVCLVIDYENEVAKAIEKVLMRGYNFKIVKIRKERLHSSPIPEAFESFKSCDIIIAPTKNSISHSPETSYVRKKLGVRVASMPGINKEIFIRAMKVNRKKVEEIGKKLIKRLKGKEKIRIISNDYIAEANIKNKSFKNDDGDISKPGVLNNVPFGEICCYGVKINGELKIDSWRGELNDAIIKLKNGKIIDYSKGAEKFVKYLEKAGECGLNTNELGFGTNYGIKKAIGNVLNDEKIYGSLHIGFGGGGKIKCKVHEDVIILKPTVILDGKKIIENGKFLF